MPHIYHLIRRNFQGEILYPLNRLRDAHPELYEEHARKYRGREILLTRRIPIRDCLWNDVLHFSPVHPAQIRDGFCAAGYDWKPRRWFEVDPAVCGFDVDNTIFYYPRPRERGDFTTREDDFVVFDPELLPGMATLPEETAAYYAEAVAAGEQVFGFRFIPHVLHLGIIDCNDVAVIEM